METANNRSKHKRIKGFKQRRFGVVGHGYVVQVPPYGSIKAILHGTIVTCVLQCTRHPYNLLYYKLQLAYDCCRQVVGAFYTMRFVTHLNFILQVACDNCGMQPLLSLPLMIAHLEYKFLDNFHGRLLSTLCYFQIGHGKTESIFEQGIHISQ